MLADAISKKISLLGPFYLCSAESKAVCIYAVYTECTKTPAWTHISLVVGHPEPEKNSVGIFEYILASMLKVYLDVF